MGKFSEAFGRGSSDNKEPPGPPPPTFHEAIATGSTTQPKQQQQQWGQEYTAYACLCLASRDKLRTVNFPEHTFGAIEEAVQRVWAPGIQARGLHSPGSYEWKLKGNPWYGQGSEAVWARRLVVHVLHALAAIGWHVLVAADLTKKQYDKDSIFFKSGPQLQRNMFAISFNESDKIRIIDAPNQTVLEAFKTVVAQSWAGGVQDAKWYEDNCWQIKLRGRPWYTSSGDRVNETRMMMCNLLGTMDHHGFELVASVDQSIGSDGALELDTWFFASKLPDGRRI